jgi:L,D-transpeptidase YcbB
MLRWSSVKGAGMSEGLGAPSLGIAPFALAIWLMAGTAMGQTPAASVTGAAGEPASAASAEPAKQDIPAGAQSTSSQSTPAQTAAPRHETAPEAAASSTPDPLVSLILARLTAGTASAQDRSALTAFYGANGAQPIWTSATGYSARGTSALAELRRAEVSGLDGHALGLPAEDAFASTPQAQADAEFTVAFAGLNYARQARGGRTDPAAISRLIDLRPTLLTPKAVLDAVVATDDAGAVLRGFHPQHQGFQRLRAALISARATTTAPDTIQRIVVNMERWRWLPADMGPMYVWNNIPEQMTRVIKAGEMILTERIVVGKPHSPTPQFSANMLYVIFHPSWGVPEGIKNNELGPMLRRASSGGGNWLLGDGGSRAGAALARHNLTVMRNGQVVNPDNIDWNAVNVREFSFTQPPSGRNVLGVVKFRFPNRHDVYMHDTSERHLFNASQRAFSHGCMRVQNPMQLAEVLLSNDKGWSKEKVNGFVGRGATADIALDKPVPVHITYFTASADEAGKLHLHGDLYGMDQRVASALSGKAVHLAALPAAEQPAVPRTAATRLAKRRGSGTPAVQSAAWGNPFSGLVSN